MLGSVGAVALWLALCAGGAVAVHHAHARGVRYFGGPVMHADANHVIFWNPSNRGLSWDARYKAVITRFLMNAAAGGGRPRSLFSLLPQYKDAAGPATAKSTFAGALDDSDPAPANDCTLPDAAPDWPVCLRKSDLSSELEGFVIAHRLPTGLADLYFLVTPEGFGSCIGAGPRGCSLGGSAASGYCGWHTNADSVRGTILYANIAYDAERHHCRSANPRPNKSSADPTLSFVAHELAEAVTDPLSDAWGASTDREVADLCLTTFGKVIGGSGATAYNAVIGSGHYYLQEIWSNADGACMPHVARRAR
jgi:hypothetical protein